MYCDNCGCEIQPGMTVCPVCGKAFSEDDIINMANMQVNSQIPATNNVMPGFQNQNIMPKDFSDDDESTTILTSDENMINDNDEDTTILTSGENMNEDEEDTSVLTGPMNVRPGITPTGPNGMPPMQVNGIMPVGSDGTLPNGMPINGMSQMQSKAGDKKNDKKADKKAKKAAKKAEKKVGNKKEVSRTGKIIRIIVGIVIILVIIIIARIEVIYVLKSRKYDKAETALQNGEIDNAIDYYSECGDYKDAQTKVNGGAYFEYAAALEENQDYIKAADNYRKAAGLAYEGAADKEKECYFNYGEKLYSEGSYTEAITYYKRAEDYAGAADKIKECSYKNGCELMKSGDYTGAAEAFTSAEDYEDAVEKIKECQYDEAQALMDAGDYETASTAFIKSGYSDYADKSNECLLLQAEAYADQENYEKAIATYEKVDSSYKDCTKKISSCHKKWANKLYDNKDYKGAVEQYELVTNGDMTKKIYKAKEAYIKDHFDSSDETTMDYLCDFRYADYGSAEEDYKTLTGWSVQSFVNSKEKDYDTRKNSLKGNKTIYVHSMFKTDGDATLNLHGYIIYSDGTKSEDITFGQIENNFATWVSVAPENAIVGDTTLYIYDSSSGNLIEKYTFKIKES